MSRRTDDLRAQWAERGYVVTDDHLARARQRLDALEPISDDRHQRNLTWLEQFDSDPAAAA